MYLERLSVQGVDANNNPNKYFKPGGQFNTAQQYADINLPNCTTYCFCRGYEAMEATERFPWVRAGGGFGNAKDWYKTTIFAKGQELLTGSVAVFDGNYGHVAFVEKRLDATHAIISESNYDANKSRRDWKYWRSRVVELIPGKITLEGVGKLIGFIYLPVNSKIVDRDENRDQIEVLGQYINVRTNPSLSASKYTGTYCPQGIYNVLDIKEADGYTWYKLENQYWVAGVDEIKFYPKPEPEVWVEPETVPEDRSRSQIYVNNKSGIVRIRESASTKSEIMGACKNLSYYNVDKIEKEDDYTWYNIGYRSWVAGVKEVEFKEAEEIMSDWVQPEAVKQNDQVDQIFINNDRGVVRIRKGPSTKDEIMGACVNHVYYNVIDQSVQSDFTWYNIGENSWVAGVDEVEFKQAKVWVEPIPVEKDTLKNQVYINNKQGVVRIRKEPSMSGTVMGYVENLVYYNVLDVTTSCGYKWYHLGPDSYTAGIPEVEYYPAEEPTPVWVEPTPVDRNTKVNQIQVTRSEINIRKGPSTDDEIMGTCKNNVYYNVLSEDEGSGYTWYKIGDEAFVANVNGINYLVASELPSPVHEDINKDQLYVPDVLLSIRTDSTTSSKRIGYCEENSNYNVLTSEVKSDYTWYKLGDNAWVAGIEEVVYYPAGSSRKGPALKKEIPALKSSLDIALTCVNRNEQMDLYDELYTKVTELRSFIDNNFDPFDYDIVDPNEYDEIDLLYTADVHGAWVGYDEDGNYLSPVFNYDDLNSYRTKLKKNNIKALLVDCGDWSRPCRVYTDYVNTGEMVSATQMNNKDYFASTYGNHEWKWGDPNETINILNQNKSMTACNMFRNGKLVYKPYRTAKIGSKRIGVIGIGYPSPNGQGSYSDGEWTYGDFVFYDGDKLFKQVQKYVDELKAANFDYIVVITHMCKSTYESDGRYKARTDSLIENTNGLTAVLQGHYNFATNAESISDKGGKSVLLAHEAGANMNSFGRLQLKGSRISSYLLDERSDLNVI